MTTTAAVPWLCPRDKTCPNVHAHDTFSAHRHGCRSGKAIADKRRYGKLVEAGLHPSPLLPAGPYARRLQCLAARGWRAVDIAGHSTLGKSQIKNVMGGRNLITQASARAVDAVFRELWWRDGPSALGRTRALGRGWVPAAAFDDIDNMDELPKLGLVRDRSIPNQHRGDTLDRRATIDRMTRAGRSAREIAEHLGISERNVVAHRAAIAAANPPEAEQVTEQAS